MYGATFAYSRLMTGFVQETRINTGNGSFQRASSRLVDTRFAAVGDDRDANSVVGSETDPRTAIVSATVLFQDSADRLELSMDHPSPVRAAEPSDSLDAV